MKRSLFPFLLLVISTFSLAQLPVGWQESFGGSSTDKGYLIAGQTYSTDGVNPPAPTANAGTDQMNCGTLTTNLEGNDPESGLGVWSQINGTGTITFGDANTYNTTATASVYGAYVLQWTITSGIEVSSDEIVIILNEDPVDVSAGADQVVYGILSTSLEGISHTYQPGSDHSGSTMQWSFVSGPDANPVFSDNTSPTSNVSVTQQGTYVFRLTETNGTRSQMDEVAIAFSSEKSNNIFVQLTDVIQQELNNINIYPNPTEDLITIETGKIEQYKLEITSITGQLVIQEEVTDPVYPVDVSSFTNGIYFIKIRVEDQVTIKTIIKK